MSVEQVKEKAKALGLIVRDPQEFITPGQKEGVKIALYVATGESLSDGFHYAGFDDEGRVIAVGRETGGPGAFTSGGWAWIAWRFGDISSKHESPLAILWE